MNKKTKAVLAGLAFVAGCEIGLAIAIYNSIRNYIRTEKAETPGNETEAEFEPETEAEFEAETAAEFDAETASEIDAETGAETEFETVTA